MNALAAALNTTLESTVVARLLSDLGTRMYFPRGIVAQSAEASRQATKMNATVGMAYDGGDPMTLPAMRQLTAALTTRESVAYAPTAGIPALRDRWKAEMEAKNPDLRGATMTRPAVVPGLTAGLALAADLFADPGRELILPDLFWGNYRLIFEERHGTTLRTFPFFADGRFNVAGFAERVRAAEAGGRVMVLLNVPNNPAGFSPSRDEIDRVVAILTDAADRVPVMVISDDAYFGLAYRDDAWPHSIFSLLADAHANLLAVKVDGATKEEFAWGLRVGFMTFAFRGMTDDHAAALEQKLMGAIRSNVSNSSTIGQSLVLKLLEDPGYGEQKRAAFATLARRFEVMQEILARKATDGRAPMLRPLPCNAGYFMSFACDGIDAEAIRRRLLDEGIGVIAIGSAYVRVAFAGIDGAMLPDLFDAIFTAAEAIAAGR